MAYELYLSDDARERLFTLGKKNRASLRTVLKKLAQVCQDPHRYKPLTGNLAGKYRGHVLSSFVITYRVDDSQGVVKVLVFDHHDEAYK